MRRGSLGEKTAHLLSQFTPVSTGAITCERSSLVIDSINASFWNNSAGGNGGKTRGGAGVRWRVLESKLCARIARALSTERHMEFFSRSCALACVVSEPSAGNLLPISINYGPHHSLMPPKYGQCNILWQGGLPNVLWHLKGNPSAHSHRRSGAINAGNGAYLSIGSAVSFQLNTAENNGGKRSSPQYVKLQRYVQS